MRLPQPWPIEAFARDTAELIEAVCEPPVAIVGSSLGSAIVQQVAIDRPDLLRCAVVMGTGAWSTGWAGTTRRRRSSSAAREAASTA
jgi:pimeloyl-ACP methyl ester carboxylesterase